MSLYGILKSQTNNGLDSELLAVFSTPLSIISNQPAFVSDTLNLKRRTNSQGVQRWEIEAQLMPTNNSADLMIHTVLNSNTSDIYVRMPQVYGTNRLPDGLTLTVTNVEAADTTVIELTGLSGNTFPAGHFIRFGNDPKVYMVVQDIGGAIQIHPPLVRQILDTTAVAYNDQVTLRAKYEIDTAKGITYIDGVLADNGVVKLVESL